LGSIRFSETITGQFYGDEHVDTFRIFYEDPHNSDSRPTGVQFTGPSVTTYWNMNPAYRVWTADAGTGQLLDADTYFAELRCPFKAKIHMLSLDIPYLKYFQ
jgi:hypothetical protein